MPLVSPYLGVVTPHNHDAINPYPGVGTPHNRGQSLPINPYPGVSTPHHGEKTETHIVTPHNDQQTGVHVVDPFPDAETASPAEKIDLLKDDHHVDRNIVLDDRNQFGGKNFNAGIDDKDLDDNIYHDDQDTFVGKEDNGSNVQVEDDNVVGTDDGPSIFKQDTLVGSNRSTYSEHISKEQPGSYSILEKLSESSTSFESQQNANAADEIVSFPYKLLERNLNSESPKDTASADSAYDYYLHWMLEEQPLLQEALDSLGHLRELLQQVSASLRNHVAGAAMLLLVLQLMSVVAAGRDNLRVRDEPLGFFSVASLELLFFQ